MLLSAKGFLSLLRVELDDQVLVDVRENLVALGQILERSLHVLVVDFDPLGEANLTSNRQRIDGFILKMANAGLKVKRKDIWQVANYTDRTDCERFQRGTSRNKAAATTFNRVLSMAPEDFSKLMKRKT